MTQVHETPSFSFGVGDRVVPNEVEVAPLVEMGMVPPHELEVARRGGIVTAVTSETMLEVSWQGDRPRRTSASLVVHAPSAQPEPEPEPQTEAETETDSDPQGSDLPSPALELFKAEVCAVAAALKAVRDETEPLPVALVNRMAKDVADGCSRMATLYVLVKDDADTRTAMDTHLREHNLSL